MMSGHPRAERGRSRGREHGHRGGRAANRGGQANRAERGSRRPFHGSRRGCWGRKGTNMPKESGKPPPEPAPVDPKVQRTLQNAITDGHDERVKSLIQEESACLNSPFDSGMTPLILALQKGADHLVDLMLEHGAKACIGCKMAALFQPTLNRARIFNSTIEERNPNTAVFMYPLDVALYYKSAGSIKKLLEHGASPRSSCTQPVSSLAMFAVEEEDVELLRFILELDKKERMYEVVFNSQISLSHHLDLAVRKGNCSMVEVLLKNGAHPNVEHNGTVPLLLAADQGDKTMCQTLLDHGANLQEQSYQPPVLARALLADLSGAIQILLDLGSDVNSKVTCGFMDYDQDNRPLQPNSPLVFLAIHKRNLNMLKMLVNAGARLNETDHEKNTALHLACADKGLPMSLLKELVHLCSKMHNWRKSTLNAANHYGLTPLMIAAKNGSSAVVSLLLLRKADANMNAEGKMERKAALHFAVDSNDEATLLALLKAKVKVDIHSTNGYTPLHLALERSNENFVEILLSHGASLDAKTKMRESCLHLAINSQNTELIETVLSHGISVNIASLAGETALMLAARLKNKDICYRIIQNGALLNIRDKNRETALLLSVYFGNEINARLLVSEGANMDLGDIRKTTPIYWCFYNSRLSVLRLLIVAGVHFSQNHLQSYPKNISAMRNRQLVKWLNRRLCNAASLQELSCRAVRSWLVVKAQGRGIRKLTHALPLPPKLKSYVMLESAEWDCVFNGEDDDEETE